LKFTRFAALVALAGIMIAGPSEAAKLDSSFLRSLLIPGSGQAHNGRFFKAALFASAGIIGGTGVFITQIHYNRAVEKYNDEKAAYIALGKQVDNGNLVSYYDIENTYASMQNSFDQAKRRYKWRNVFLTTLIAGYTLNLVDVIMSGPSPDSEPGLSLNVGGDGIRLVKSISF